MTNVQEKTEKDLTPITSGKVREAYYNTYCYLRNLQEAGWDLNDEELTRDAELMLEHLEFVHKHLEANYQWD